MLTLLLPITLNANISRFVRFLFFIALAVLILLVAAQPAQAATITVSNSCSLANAIRSANSDSATGGCTAGSGADAINFTGTVTLSAALPAITSDITISGGTIDGNDTYRPFEVNTGGHLRLSSVTVTKGSALGGLDGGAITVSGTGALTLTNTTVSNSAVAAEGEGGGGAGGGIYFEGSGGLTISNSTISGNEAERGGGIYVAGTGTMTITSSVISGNSASSRGGGVFIKSSATLTISRSAIHGSRVTGGDLNVGIAIHSLGALTVENSSFYDNDTTQTLVSAKSAITNLGDMTLTHITLLDSDAKGINNVLNTNTLNLRNSIIAGSDGADCSGTLTSNVGNLIEDNTCSPSLSGSPQLASSATGSPPYFLPNSGSKVIGAAASAHCLSGDQTGRSRPQGNGCDIGAIERQSPTAAFTVTSQSGFTVNFDSSTSSAGGGNALTYSWDFDDDGSADSTEANPSHTYASAGTYSVTLTVSNNIGSDSTPAQSVTLVADAAPSAAFSFHANGLMVSFNSSSSTGSNLIYNWAFGDGNSSSSANPTHPYATHGDYSVTLTLSNSGGSDSETQPVSVDSVPNAQFSASMSELTVNFDGKMSGGSRLQYAWYFNEDSPVIQSLDSGMDSTEVAPVFTYPDCGAYNARLVVTNNGGTSEANKLIRLCEPDRGPSVKTASEPTTTSVPLMTSVPINTCLELNEDQTGVFTWAQYGLTSGINCQRRDLYNIHVIQAPNIEAVINAGILDVIDIWGFTGQAWEICFDNWRLGGTGGIMFIEKQRPLGRVVHTAPGAVNKGEQTCLKLQDKAGYVALVAKAPVPALALAPPNPMARSVSTDCMVTTMHMLNLRAAPAGKIIGMVADNVTLTALERTPSWFKVDHTGQIGWIAATYAQPQGECG